MDEWSDGVPWDDWLLDDIPMTLEELDELDDYLDGPSGVFSEVRATSTVAVENPHADLPELITPNIYSTGTFWS